MRSPIVWFCVGIVVLFAISAESGIQRGYHVVHVPFPGQFYQNIIPAGGFRQPGPQFVPIDGVREQRQEDGADIEEEEEEEDENEEEEEEDEESYGIQYVNTASGYYPAYNDADQEDEDEEEEDDDGDEEDDGEQGDDENETEAQARQAFVNNQYVERQPIILPPVIVGRAQAQVPIRGPLQSLRPLRTQTSTAKPTTAPVTQNEDKVKKSNEPKEPNEVKETEEQKIEVASSLHEKHEELHSQKIHLKPVATSTQFIATPVADLILRLSISLAKPVSHRNATNSFNVPIRIFPVGENVILNLNSQKDVTSVKLKPEKVVPAVGEKRPAEEEEVVEDEIAAAAETE